MRHELRSAAVLGGGMAGLLAARVLADHDLDVRVLDRDDLAEVAGVRRGVPQGRHIHALLPRGRQVLEALFPGLTAELVADGAPTGDLLGDARLHLSGHRLRRTDSDLLAVSCSRPFLEDRVRARVRQLPDVRFEPPCDVVGLSTSGRPGRVTGVRCLPRTDGSAEEVVPADLVVDALGRGSRLPTWLGEAGVQRPPEERVAVDLGYATTTFQLPPDALDGDWGSLQAPSAVLPRGGVVARIEDDRWMVTLMGLAGDHPPTDIDGFRRFARSLSFPDVADAIGDAPPLERIGGFRFPAAVRRRYEQVGAMPDGLFPVGDATCSFDPVYGQGMTVAGLAALALRDHLDDHAGPASRPYLDRLADLLDDPWDVAAGGDLAIPGVEGRRPAPYLLAGAYVPRLHAAAAHDPALATAFVRVMAMVDPPSALLRPRVALRVLRATARGREVTTR